MLVSFFSAIERGGTIIGPCAEFFRHPCGKTCGRVGQSNLGVHCIFKERQDCISRSEGWYTLFLHGAQMTQSIPLGSKDVAARDTIGT
jgi:hypothetical protein